MMETSYACQFEIRCSNVEYVLVRWQATFFPKFDVFIIKTKTKTAFAITFHIQCEKKFITKPVIECK